MLVYNQVLINLSMDRESRNKSFFIWIEEIWEEVEVQFYGIIGAIFFFVLIYFIFHPPWMGAVFDFIFSKSKLSLG